MASKKPATTTQPSKNYITTTNINHTTVKPSTIMNLDKSIINAVNTAGKSNQQPSLPRDLPMSKL